MAGSTKMAEKTKKKTTKQNKESKTKAEEEKRKHELEAKIRQRVALEEKAFRIVERYLDGKVEAEDLKEIAVHITPSHYADITEERAISQLCGYPQCSKSLVNVPAQKYKISTKTNKVYDITERKKYCCNECYKASRYYDNQLSTTPVWLRDDKWEKPVITLLNRDNISGSSGEEVITSASRELRREIELLETGGATSPDTLPSHSASERPLPGTETVAEGPLPGTETVAETERAEEGSQEDEVTRENVASCKEGITENVASSLANDEVLTTISMETHGEDQEKSAASSQGIAGTTNNEVYADLKEEFTQKARRKSSLKGSSGNSSDGNQPEQPKLKKRVSISEITTNLGKDDDDDDDDMEVESYVVPARKCSSASEVSDISSLAIEEEEDDEAVIQNEVLTDTLQRKVMKRRLSLKEPPTPEVFTEGEATTLQAAAAFFRKSGATDEVFDVTSVREVILLDSDDDPDENDDKDSGEEAVAAMPRRRKSISEAATVVRRLSSPGLPAGFNPDLPGLGGAGDCRGSVASMANKRRSISEAAANRRKSTNTQIKGVKSMKEMLKSEIENLNRDECLSITDRLEQRVQARRKSLSGPSTPEVFTQGMSTTLEAKRVGNQKGSSVGEVHTTLQIAQSRMEKYRAALNSDSYEVDQFGKYHHKDFTDHEQSKSRLLNDLLDKKNNLNVVLDAAKGLRRAPKPLKKNKDPSEGEAHNGNIDSDIESLTSAENSTWDSRKMSQSSELSSGSGNSRGSRVSPRQLSASQVLSNAHMVSEQKSGSSSSKKLISPALRVQKKTPASKGTAKQLIEMTLYQWKTKETVQFLSSSGSVSSSGQKEDFEVKYRDLCRKVDSQELEISGDCEEVQVENKDGLKSLPDIAALTRSTEDYGLKVKAKEFYGMKVSESSVEPSNASESSESEPKEIILPYIDSHSQMALRRKIVMDKLNRALTDLLRPVQLSLTDVSSGLRQLVHTFKFSSSNITLKRPEWTLVGFLMLKLLCLKEENLRRRFEAAYVSHYLRAMTLSAGLTDTDLHSFVAHMTQSDVMAID